MTSDVEARVAERAAAWSVRAERRLDTPTAVLVFGARGGVPVVLKVARRAGDEWRAGEIAAAFGGRGVARVYEYVEGAVLLERLSPGTQLAERVVPDGDDDGATRALAALLAKMSPADPPPTCATVEQWSGAFARYLAGADERIPRVLVLHAQRVYAELAATQRNPVLLHGDLHHYNVLLDDARGWIAVDPKGVVGELEFELGAVLRNPKDCPDLIASSATVERRLERFREALGIDVGRARAWAFAQGVLSAVWSVEDREALDARHAGLAVARAIAQATAFRSDFPA